MAKEFALEQRLGYGRAIHLDERCVAPRAAQVQCTRKQLFAGARLTQQQHAGTGRRHPFQFTQGLQQRRRCADDAVARRRAFQRARQLVVARHQTACGGRHQPLQLQQLPGQCGQYAQNGHVVVQLSVAAAYAVAAQHAHRATVHFNGQRDVGHGFWWQPAARHHAEQEGRLGVHVLHGGRLAGGQDAACHALAVGVVAARSLGARQAIGVVDGRAAGFIVVIAQHDAAAVQTQQLAHQMQHLAQHHLGRQTLAHAAHHLRQQQQLLHTPVGGGGFAGGGCRVVHRPAWREQEARQGGAV